MKKRTLLILLLFAVVFNLVLLAGQNLLKSTDNFGSELLT